MITYLHSSPFYSISKLSADFYVEKYLLGVSVIHRVTDIFLKATTILHSFIKSFVQTIDGYQQFLHIRIILSPIVGSVLIITDTALEILSVKRLVSFKTELNKNKSILEKIQFLQNKYFTLNGEEQKTIEIKKNDLSKQLRSWLVLEMEKKIPSILDKLQSISSSARDQGLKEAQQILSKIEMQIKKKLLVHKIAFVALGLGSISVILTFLHVVLAAILVIVCLHILLIGVRYLASAGMLNHNGWDFRLEECIPDCIRPLIYS